MTDAFRKFADSLSERIVAELTAEVETLQLLDKETASKLMGISEMTFERMKLPRIKFGDGRTAAARYRLSDIKKAIEQRTERRAALAK